MTRKDEYAAKHFELNHEWIWPNLRRLKALNNEYVIGDPVKNQFLT